MLGYSCVHRGLACHALPSPAKPCHAKLQGVCSRPYLRIAAWSDAVVVGQGFVNRLGVRLPQRQAALVLVAGAVGQ